ncbi:class I SAM-dependent methyltransferase, partial [Georgenia sp.]
MDSPSLDLLLAPAGRALLAALPPYRQGDVLALSTALRAEHPPELVAAALTQSRLRARAATKLGDRAAGMLFTTAGLEQATRAVVSAHHAARYVAAGRTRVADLGCGLGSDAMALAARGLGVLAVESDAVTARLAAENLAPWPAAQVHHGDALAMDLEGVDAVFADPARRRSGRRIFDPAAYSPPLDALLALRARVPAVGLKVAPGLPHAALPRECHAQWVSVDGDVVEAGLWFDVLAPEGPGRSALVLAGEHAHPLAEAPDLPRARTAPDAPARSGQVRRLGEYLYEPDGAVIRAGLVARLAELLGAGLVSPDIAYLTADRFEPTPFATAYRVLDHLPFGLKRLRAYLRERDVGILTVKKRGTAVEPEQLRRQLALRGSASATVVLTRLDDQHSVL